MKGLISNLFKRKQSKAFLNWKGDLSDLEKKFKKFCHQNIIFYCCGF